MGHTAAEWADKVLLKLNDAAEADIAANDVFAMGVVPALAQFSIDQPHSAAVDLTPTGRFLALPTAADGWVSQWSTITAIEAPAGETPPVRLNPLEWSLTRSTATPGTQVVLLPYELAVGDTARVFFTAAWPTPTADPTVDLVSDLAYEAVASLAASYVCTALATTAAFGRQGAIPTNFVDGTERSRYLLDAAAQLRTLYNTFIGLGSVAAGGATASVSSRTLKSVRYS